ncbi:MAG: hypothetical protein II456_06585 [Firmicutes bacterium]|nr:hypothetical protein [Bacillota bacterium]
MIDLKQLDSIIQEAKDRANGLKDACATGAAQSAQSFDLPDGNILYQGDGPAVMQALAANGCAGRMQCIYLDPPFLSGADYQATVRIRSEKLGEELSVKVPAYADTWRKSRGADQETASGAAAYFRTLAESLVLARELLTDTGLLWLHLDWHSVHYARVMLDAVFGEERFINEIIWQYKSGGSSKRHFARKHDTILVYAKTADYRLHVGKEKSYNRGLKPYRFKGVEEYEDETGWYTLVNEKDVWSIDMVGRTSAERNGYATQKPMALMERIIAASTEPGDLTGDFCCGSGGFLEAAARGGRRAVGCDQSSLALALTEKRLRDAGIPYTRYNVSVEETDTTNREEIPGIVKPGDRAVLERIIREDPAALTLFHETMPDGTRRTVDVFGAEHFS